MNWEDYAARYWARVAAQDEDALREYFCEDAVIRWHATNEQFTVEEFLRANCDYPGRWQGRVERIARAGGLLVTAARVWSGEASFHVVSFFEMAGEKIKALDEYWGDDGAAPSWRIDKNIGRPIG